VIQYLDPDRYVGVDVRSTVLDLGWQEIGLAHLSEKNPRLIRSDDFGAAELGGRKFDFIWAFSVLYHLSDEILQNLFSNVGARLVPGGRFVANVQTDVEDSTWLEFPFLKRSVEAYESLAKAHGLKVSNLGTIAERGFRLPGAERNNVLLEFTPT
jgi:SAM-dependent methyltransferase